MQITSLKLIALTGVVGLGFLVVLNVHEQISQPATQLSSQEDSQAVADLGESAQSFPDFGEGDTLSDGMITVEQSEPVVDNEFSPDDSEPKPIPNISDAIPHLASNDHFRSEPAETESPTRTGMTLDFSTPAPSIEQTGYDADSSSGPAFAPRAEETNTETTEAPPFFSNDSSESGSTDSSSEPAFDPLPESTDSTPPAMTDGSDFFTAPAKETPVTAESNRSASDAFSPFDSTEPAAPSATDTADEPNPFADSQTPATPELNNLETAPHLFTEEPETSNKADEFSFDNTINTNPSSNAETLPAPFETEPETLPAFDSKSDAIPTSNANVTEPAFDESENTPDFGAAQDRPVLTAPATDQNPLKTTPSPFQTEDQNTPPQFTDESPTLSAPQSSPPPFNLTPEAAPLKSENHTEGNGIVDLDAPRGPQQPQLKIEKIAPKNAVLGQPMIYSIIVKNIGTKPAHQVVVEDQIPRGTELTGTIPQGEMDDKRLIWKVGTFQPGDEKKILVRVIPHKEGQVGSVATVHFFSEVAAQTLVKPPELELTISSPTQAKIGEPVTFRFKVTNTGTEDAKKVFLRDIIPEGLTHSDGNDLEYPIGDLPSGKSEEISLTLTAAGSGIISNRAVVTADGGVKIEKTAALKILQSPLVLSRTGPRLRYVGRESEFTNLVTNDSDSSVAQTTVTEIVPAGMKFIEATSGGHYNPGTRTVAWSIDRLAPKQSKELKVKLIPTETGTKTSVVQAVDASGMKVGTSSQTQIEGFAALSLDVTPPEQPIAVGERLTLHIVARNRGTAAARNLKLKITLPPEMEAISARGPTRYTQQGNQILFDSVEQMNGKKQAGYTLSLKALRSGDARIRVEISSDALRQPLIRDEAVLILPKNQ